MTESSRASAPEWSDPDDAPEWSDAMFDRAAFTTGGREVRRRPPAIAAGLLDRKASLPKGVSGVFAMAKKTTGKKAASNASDVLTDGRTSKKSKSAAGSALSQVEKSKGKKK